MKKCSWAVLKLPLAAAGAGPPTRISFGYKLYLRHSDIKLCTVLVAWADHSYASSIQYCRLGWSDIVSKHCRSFMCSVWSWRSDDLGAYMHTIKGVQPFRSSGSGSAFPGSQKRNRKHANHIASWWGKQAFGQPFFECQSAIAFLLATSFATLYIVLYKLAMTAFE